MEWLHSPERRATLLPAVWLIATPERPGTLPERAALRRSVAHALLARQLGLDPARIEIGHAPGGCPRIIRPPGSGLHLSLATRAGVVAVALAARPVGVDIERIDSTAAPPLAVLHPAERAALGALPAAERSAAFARLWSVKEAYVKALGTGFVTPPDSFAVRLAADGTVAIAHPGGPRIVLAATAATRSGGQEHLTAAIVVLA